MGAGALGELGHATVMRTGTRAAGDLAEPLRILFGLLVPESLTQVLGRRCPATTAVRSISWPHRRAEGADGAARNR